MSFSNIQIPSNAADAQPCARLYALQPVRDWEFICVDYGTISPPRLLSGPAIKWRAWQAISNEIYYILIFVLFQLESTKFVKLRTPNIHDSISNKACCL
jgi:hypothetical protein